LATDGHIIKCEVARYNSWSIIGDKRPIVQIGVPAAATWQRDRPIAMARLLQRFQGNFFALVKPWALAHLITSVARSCHRSVIFAGVRCIRGQACWAKLGAGSGKARPL
jgi:hypothetical protein